MAGARSLKASWGRRNARRPDSLLRARQPESAGTCSSSPSFRLRGRPYPVPRLSETEASRQVPQTVFFHIRHEKTSFVERTAQTRNDVTRYYVYNGTPVQ